MKISSQLANNFDCCSTEILDFKRSPPRPQRLRGELSETFVSFDRKAVAVLTEQGRSATLLV